MVLYGDLCNFAVFRHIARLRGTCGASHGAVKRTMRRKLRSTLAAGEVWGEREGKVVGK